jgi:hypothetical protein
MTRTVAALLLAMASLNASAVGGAIDTSIGKSGIAPVWDTTDVNLVVARAPDGKFIVVRNTADYVIVMRRLADGMPDTTFGTGGEMIHVRAVPTGSPVAVVPLAVKRVIFQGTRMLLVGEATASCGTPGIARLNANGNVDVSFGTRGWSTPVPATRGIPSCFYGDQMRIADFRLLADGRIALVAQSFEVEGGQAVRGDVVAARWSANGEPDMGLAGRGYVSGFPWQGEGGGGRSLEDGSVLVARSESLGGGRYRPVVSTLAAAGTRSDAAPNVAEELRTAPLAASVQGDGSVLFYNPAVASTLTVQRVVRGVVDASYGASGLARVALGYATTVRFALAAPDGGTLFISDAEGAGNGRNELIVLHKLDGVGRLEPSFASGGRLDFSGSALSEFPHQASMDVDGYLSFIGYTTARVAGEVRYAFYFARIQAVPDIVEFENSTLRHYFTTYDNAEARGVDAGAAGPGWRRTGISFRPGGGAAVCRFYGTPGVGPNSHFYTADPGECELVKTLRGWTYEGIAFHVTVPELVGSCRLDQRAVYRFYNNRAAQNDSNHRYLADETFSSSMTAAGWLLEGLVFCAPR